MHSRGCILIPVKVAQKLAPVPFNIIWLDIMEVRVALVNNLTNMSNQPLSPTAPRAGIRTTQHKFIDRQSPGGSSSVNELLKSPNTQNKRRVSANSAASGVDDGVANIAPKSRR